MIQFWKKVQRQLPRSFLSSFSPIPFPHTQTCWTSWDWHPFLKHWKEKAAEHSCCKEQIEEAWRGLNLLLVPTPFLTKELHRPMNEETPYLHTWTNPIENKNKMINQKISPLYPENFSGLENFTIRRSSIKKGGKNTTKHLSGNNFISGCKQLSLFWQNMKRNCFH